MRVGENPAKTIQRISKPRRITVAVLSYVPFISGYYSEALEVLKACLDGIWKNSDLPYDLMVFDNGSCEETREFLLDAQIHNKIQYSDPFRKKYWKGRCLEYDLSGRTG